MAVTANDLRASLEGLWNNPTASGIALRDALVAQELISRRPVSGGTITRTSGNMRAVEFSDRYGPGAITPVENAQIWRELINAFGESLRKLTYWAKRGIDPYSMERQGIESSSDAATVSPAIIVDTLGQWASLCAEYGEATADVIGKVVGDTAIFLWMMDHLVSVKEIRPDFSGMRIAAGTSWA